MKSLLPVLVLLLSACGLNAQVVAYDTTAPGSPGLNSSQTFFGTTGVVIGLDDYNMDTSVLPPGATTCDVSEFYFIGNIITNGDNCPEVLVEFLDVNGAPVASESVTIHPSISQSFFTLPMSVTIPVSGQVRLTLNSTSFILGEWVISSDPSVYVGSSAPSPGPTNFGINPLTGAHYSYAFSITCGGTPQVNVLNFIPCTTGTTHN